MESLKKQLNEQLNENFKASLFMGLGTLLVFYLANMIEDGFGEFPVWFIFLLNNVFVWVFVLLQVCLVVRMTIIIKRMINLL